MAFEAVALVIIVGLIRSPVKRSNRPGFPICNERGGDLVPYISQAPVHIELCTLSIAVTHRLPQGNDVTVASLSLFPLQG